jgi:hypothetical protein
MCLYTSLYVAGSSSEFPVYCDMKNGGKKFWNFLDSMKSGQLYILCLLVILFLQEEKRRKCYETGNKNNALNAMVMQCKFRLHDKYFQRERESNQL